MKKRVALFTFFTLLQVHASVGDVKTFNIPFENSLPGRSLDGKVNVDISAALIGPAVTDDFYGADNHGFDRMPGTELVSPLKLGHIKLGGNLHSKYNWDLNAYYSNYSDRVEYVYSPLERRLEIIKNNFGLTPMLQVNMMGWMPDQDGYGNIVYTETADANFAAEGILFLNKEKNVGLQNVLMGNEPFHWEEVHGKAKPSADEYIEKYIDYAIKLREAQEQASGNANDIKLWGPELATGWTGWQTTHPQDCREDYSVPGGMVCSYGNGQFKSFIPYFLKSLAQAERDSERNPKGYKLLDVLTLHYYPLFRDKFQDTNSIITDKNDRQFVPAMLESVNVWDDPEFINKYDGASPKNANANILQKFKQWRNENYDSAEIAVTEFGIDSVVKINYHPIVRPLYLADLMPRLAQSGVKTFVKSFLQSGSGGDSNAWALIKGSEQSRLYTMYYLFSNNYLGHPLQNGDSYGDLVNSYAVKSDRGVNVFIVNKDAQKHATRLTFDSNGNSTKVADVELPAWSLTVLNVPASRNGQITVNQYGAEEMGIAVESYYGSDNAADWE